jgi:repressor LexA
MSVLGDNIARLRAEKGISQRDMAEDLGISKGTVGAWESKDTIPDWKKLKQIASYLDVSVHMLFLPYIPMRDDQDYSSVETKVYGKIAAGTPLEMEEGDYGFPCPTTLIKRHPKAFFLEIEGESMSRVIPDKSLVLVDPDLKEPVVSGQVYAVCVNGYDATVKRIRMLANGIGLEPDSLDPTYHMRVFDNNVPDTETITIIGRVVWYTVPFDIEI